MSDSFGNLKKNENIQNLP